MNQVETRFKCPKCGTPGNCAGAGEQDAGLCHCPDCDNDWDWTVLPPDPPIIMHQVDDEDMTALREAADALSDTDANPISVEYQKLVMDLINAAWFIQPSEKK